MSGREVGITTTLPVEVLVAAGLRPVDLNNRFVTSDRAAARVELADVDRRMGEGLRPGLAARAHLLLLSGSDFAGGDPEAFSARVRESLGETEGPAAAEPGACLPPCLPDRQAHRQAARLALAGIPPIVGDLFERAESFGARVVLAEMAREFAMIRPADSLLSQYLAYTYPYDIFHRLGAPFAAAREREADGVIHYVQSFCFRGVQDRLLRERAEAPVLTLECDRPGRLDERSATRLEAFVEMLFEPKAAASRGRASG